MICILIVALIIIILWSLVCPKILLYAGVVVIFYLVAIASDKEGIDTDVTIENTKTPIAPKEKKVKTPTIIKQEEQIPLKECPEYEKSIYNECI